jgi:O-antigen ligase
MGSLEVIFAWIVTVLAGLACIGALAVVLVAEVYAIRRTIKRHRKPGPPPDPSGRWWRERSAVTVPDRRP